MVARFIARGLLRTFAGFPFEFLNKRRCLTNPFQLLLGGETVKLGVTVEIRPGTLRQRTGELLGGRFTSDGISQRFIHPLWLWTILPNRKGLLLLAAGWIALAQSTSLLR